MAAKAVEWVLIMEYYTYYIATTCTSTCRWPYRLWESVEGGGGGSMRPYCQNLTVYIKFYYCIPLARNTRARHITKTYYVTRTTAKANPDLWNTVLGTVSP
jgi:hypothetical protein